MESDLDHIQPHYAFPHPSGAQGTDGLTKREWFAGQLMPSIIAATSAGQHFPTKAEGDTHIVQAIARDAVQAADALISALETKT